MRNQFLLLFFSEKSRLDPLHRDRLESRDESCDILDISENMMNRPEHEEHSPEDEHKRESDEDRTEREDDIEEIF